MKDIGLKEVGIIKFKSCNTGSGRFLQEFSKELGKNGINHGYCSGMTEIAYSRSPNPNAWGFGNGYSVTKNVNFGSEESLARDKPKNNFDRLKRAAFKVLHYVPIALDIIEVSQKERFNIRVVDGPCAVSFPGTRYTKPRTEDRPLIESAEPRLTNAAFAARPEAPDKEWLRAPGRRNQADRVIAVVGAPPLPGTSVRNLRNGSTATRPSLEQKLQVQIDGFHERRASYSAQDQHAIREALLDEARKTGNQEARAELYRRTRERVERGRGL